ncbi:DedA family protein [Streptomyces sp. RS10V-4]|uniref:DedA family protein n=1 Tax=Streptomyces rhizoryzae TaxID=2932493 RepID=UPI00200434DF|nr:DedA family protein [Streptomyces rhizoryzae]MCK7626679.1 DedA family protein [Streptomyces rhizoryzae]
MAVAAADLHLSTVTQAVDVLDAGSLLAAFGALGVAVVLFAETGLLVGFLLPGDSLLFTAGLLSAPGVGGAVHLALPQVLAAAAAGTLAGSQTGYWIGRRGGRALLARGRSRKLREGAARAEEYLARYGHAKALVLARFVPVVRTVLNPLAGALDVPARTFALWQVTGGLFWTAGLTLAGYALGSSVPNVDRYLLPAVGLVVLASLTPIALEVRRARRRRPAGGPANGAADAPESATAPPAP